MSTLLRVGGKNTSCSTYPFKLFLRGKHYYRLENETKKQVINLNRK